MKRALVVAGCVVALLLAATASGSVAKAKPLTPATTTKAFGRLLHQLYGPLHGYWTCPSKQSFGGKFDCLGEVEAAGRWHSYGARAELYHGIVDFHLPAAVTWTRRWSPFSRHYILRSSEGQVKGVVSVNSPAYDWGWLALQLGKLKDGQRTGADAFDGDSGGLGRFYDFACSRAGALITCRNALGDAMRYRP